MTPEEKAQEVFFASLQAAHVGNDSEFVANIAQAIREAKIEAYEEAARKMDDYRYKCEESARKFADAEEGTTDGNMYWRCDGASDALEIVAQDVRALNDSLVPEISSCVK